MILTFFKVIIFLCFNMFLLQINLSKHVKHLGKLFTSKQEKNFEKISIRYRVIVILTFFKVIISLCFNRFSLQINLYKDVKNVGKLFTFKQKKKIWKNINPLWSYSHLTSCRYNVKFYVVSCRQIFLWSTTSIFWSLFHIQCR